MTATQMPAVNHDEITAVNLADEHAEEAAAAFAYGYNQASESIDRLCGLLAANAQALLALGARVDALRETLNRELPDIGESILDVARNVPSD